MTERRVELESRLQAIERTEDVVALGTAKEQESWRLLAAMEPQLALLPNDAESDEMRAKQRFLRGLLLWDLRRDYKARLWAERKALSDLDRQLREAQRRHHQVSSSRDDWPEKFTALTARIEGLRPRVLTLKQSADLALAAPAGVSAKHRRRRTEGAARPVEHVHGPGPLRARVDLRSRGGARRAYGGQPSRRARGGRPMSSAPLLVLLAAAAIWPFGRDRDREEPVEPTGTIKDLERADVEVDTQARIVGSEAKAMESYRLFLDVASDDPALKAEAMRRLADLQLETADAEEIASNVQALGTLGSTIEMYEQLLDVLSELPEERSRALSARAGLRGRRANRRVACDARPAHRGVSANGAPRRGAVPPRRDVVRPETLPRVRARVRVRARRRRGLAVLRAIPLQARLGAVQATAIRRQLGVVLHVARPPARNRQRRERRPRSCRPVCGDGARAAGAHRRYVPRAVDRVFVPRRARIDLAALQPPRRAAVLVHRLHESWAICISSKNAIKMPPTLITRSSISTRITPRRLCCKSRSSKRSRKASSRTSCSRARRASSRPTGLKARTGSGSRSSSSPKSSLT